MLKGVISSNSIVGITGTKAQFNTALTDGDFIYIGGNVSDLANDAGYLTSSTGVSSITGTANQIIANSPTGAVTLSLPQDIATTSTVRFGKLGIGMAPTYTVDVLTSTLTDFGTQWGIRARAPSSVTTNASNFLLAFDMDVSNMSITAGVTDSGYRLGVRGNAVASVAGFAGTLATQYGVIGRAGITTATSGAEVTNAYGLYSEVLNSVAGTTIANGYGLRIVNTGTTGTMTNRWGVYVDTGAGLGKNYFSGPTGFGTTTGVGTTYNIISTKNWTDIAALTGGIGSTGTHTLSSNNANLFAGMYSAATINQAGNNATATIGNGGGLAGMYFNAIVSGTSGTVTAASGAAGIVRNNAAGTLTNAYGFNALFFNTGGGTLTNTYGFYQGATTAGTNNTAFYGGIASGVGQYNLYMAGTAENFLAGATTINTSTTTPLLIGDTASAGNLTLQSTSHATKGKINFGTSAYDEANNRWGFGIATPLAAMHLHAVAGTNPAFKITDADVAHGMTGISSTPAITTDTIAQINAVSSTAGGLWLLGLSAGDQNPFLFEGVIGSNTPTNSPMLFRGSKFNGTTGKTAVAATEILAQFQANTTTVATMLGDGSLALGTTTSPVSTLDIASITGPIHTLRRIDTSVTANDSIGTIQFYAKDTSTTTNFIVANIEVQATNTVATDINPGRLIFRTTPTGVAAVPTEALRLDENQTTLLAKKISSYNGVTTTGWGTPAIYGTGRSTAQAAAVASVATYTVGASDGSFRVSANVLVTTATVHNFTVTCAYTDEGNTARTLTLPFTILAGTAATAITNAGGAVPYEGIPVHIRCKASTAITIATTGTFTTVAYNVEANIEQLS